MNVEGVAPLHVFGSRHSHVSVGYEPEECGHDGANDHTVDHGHPDQELEESCEMKTEGQRETGGRHYEPAEEQHQEGRIVAGELVLGLLPILEVAVPVGAIKQ